MRRVGRIYGFVNAEGRTEWYRLAAKQPNNLKNPFRFGAILAVTNAGENPPERLLAIDESIVCGKCNGSGYFPIPCHCPKCNGTGRRAIAPAQRPRFKPAPGWLASPMSQLFPHLGR